MLPRSGKNAHVNISTIAELARTSSMTVSRVLNNKPDVSKATRERVLAIIKEQGYQPHAIARKLSGGKTHIIGVALYSKGSPVVGLYVEVLRGLQAALAENDYDLLLLAPSRTDRYDERVVQTTVMDGLVLMGDRPSEDDIVHLRDSGFPFISIGRRNSGNYTTPFVAPDYEKTFNEIVDFAITNGAQNISIIIASLDHEEHPTMPAVQDRVRGIEVARKFHGLSQDAVSLISSIGGFADGYNLFLNLPTLPDAVVLDSSEFSFGVAVALRDRHIRIHHDIQLLGVDYQDFIIRRCEDVFGVPIPHWTVPWFNLGKKAAQHLIQFLTEDESKTIHEYVDFERRNLYVL